MSTTNRDHTRIALRAIAAFTIVGVIAGCGGGGDNTPAPPITRIELSADSILFTAQGQTRQLTARALDASGAIVATAKPTYTSSRPNQVSVDAAGNVRAEVGVGSALITSTVDGIASRPVLVAAVEMAPNAIAVRDSQVVVGPIQDYATAPGIGRRQTLTVTGIGTVSIGAILVGVESKVFAGRVVAAATSSGQSAVTLELIPLNEMFRNVSISVALTPDQVALISSTATVTATKTVASRERAMGEAKIAALPAAIKCTPSATLNVLSVTVTPKVTQSVGLILDTGITDGVTKQFRFLVEGTARADFDASVTLGTGSGEIDCRLRVDEITFKNLVPVLAVYGPAIHVDLDTRLTGTLSSNGSLAFSGTTNDVTLRAGVAYDPVNGVTNLSGFDPWSPTATKAPSLMFVNPAARAEVGVFAGLAFDLVLTSELLSWVPLLDPTTLELPLIGAWAGFGFDSSWGTPSDAASDRTFTPSYQFAAKGEVGVDKDLMSNTMKLLGATLPVGFDLSVKSEIVLAHSPDALQVTADRATFGVGDVVNFTVALDPLTSTFVGYNVNEIRIYELLGGATAVKVASAVAADGQWSFSIPWTATHAGTTTAGGLPLLHAFVVPRFLSAIADLLPLELGPVVDAPPVVTPPTIVTPLRDLQAVAGGTATFSVQAAGGGVLSYQWLKGSIAAPGTANSPTYTTHTLTTADNGSSYSVVVSNAGGSVTSGPALLSVAAPVQPGPDLVVQNLNFSPTSVAPGGPLQVSFTIANAGAATANASTAVIRINQSVTSSAGTNLATVNVAALATGASVNVAPSVTAPATAGSYRVWVLADNGNTAGQSASAAGNDIVLASATLTVTAAAGSPDLVASSLAFSPGSVAPGGTIQVQLGVINQGGATAAASTAVVRINQSTTSAAGSNLASISVPSLGAGASAGLSGVLVTVPTTPGSYNVWVVLDNNNTAGQSAAAAANDFVLASGTLTVTSNSSGPVVSSVASSPQPLIVGGPATFSVIGTGLQPGYIFSLPGCNATEVPSASTTLRQFTCTLTQAGASLSGGVATAAGTVLWSFNQTVATNPMASGPGGLYVGYYAENPVTNPEDPTIGGLFFTLPASNGNFAGAMFFTFSGCQTNNVGAISGTKDASGITGAWSGVVDGTSQSGSYSGAFGSALGAYSGTYTVSGGKQLISVPGCTPPQYYVAPQGTWEATQVGSSVPSTFTLSVSGTSVSWINPVGTIITWISVIDEAEASGGIPTAVKYQTASASGAPTFNLAVVSGLTSGRTYVVVVTTATAGSQRTGAASVRVVR